MKLAHAIERLRSIADERLAESWDQVGLQVGQPEQSVKQGLLCIDLTPAVLAEAAEAKCGLIVAYHPLLFHPLTRLAERNVHEQLTAELVRRKMAVYSPHTAWDSMAGGVNDWLCDLILPGWFAFACRDMKTGMGEKGNPKGAAGRELGGKIEAIRPAAMISGELCKLVTFVPGEPESRVDRLRSVLSQAGAGCIGAYRQCSFSHPGEGTFLGDETTNPAIGRRGRLERVAEQRLEMVLPRSAVTPVVRALRANHPYEEPAFDLIPLMVPPAPSRRQTPCMGAGRIVELDQPTPLAKLVASIKQGLKLKQVELASPPGVTNVKRIGLCAGAGGSLLNEAGQVDLFFTGEMRHHDVLAAVNRRQCVILAGHTQTERPFLPVMAKRLQKDFGRQMAWRVSRADRTVSAWV